MPLIGVRKKNVDVSGKRDTMCSLLFYTYFNTLSGKTNSIEDIIFAIKYLELSFCRLVKPNRLLLNVLICEI